MQAIVQKYRHHLTIKGRKIDIDESQQFQKEQIRRNLVAFIENLHFKANETDLKGFFEKEGHILI